MKDAFAVDAEGDAVVGVAGVAGVGPVARIFRSRLFQTSLGEA